jgi:hypothetical protein
MRRWRSRADNSQSRRKSARKKCANAGDKEGEAVLLCGHPRLAGSSYCKPHFHLTRDSGCESERVAGPVALRLVDAA